MGYTCFGPLPRTVASYSLYYIAVAKELHGKNIGTTLLLESEKHICTMGGKNIFSEVSSRGEYLAIRRIYAEQHYTLEATLKKYYDNNDDKLIYSKELDPVIPEPFNL